MSTDLTKRMVTMPNPDTVFVVTCPTCQEPLTLELPTDGHKRCPLCRVPFNVVNGAAEKPVRVVKLVDTRQSYG